MAVAVRVETPLSTSIRRQAPAVGTRGFLDKLFLSCMELEPEYSELER